MIPKNNMPSQPAAPQQAPQGLANNPISNWVNDNLTDPQKKFLASQIGAIGGGQQAMPATPQHQFNRQQQGMLQAAPSRNEYMANQLRGM